MAAVVWPLLRPVVNVPEMAAMAVTAAPLCKGWLGKDTLQVLRLVHRVASMRWASAAV